MSTWQEQTLDASLIAAHVEHGVDELVARLLALRGITPEATEQYFFPSLKQLAKPNDLPGITSAVNRILSYIRTSKDQPPIVIFGDYDCDGISATAIMMTALNALKEGIATPFIPERLSEGYGMSDASVERLLRDHPGVKMVLTVDNGINSAEHIKKLHHSGVEVIVTDHHLADENLPIIRQYASALVNPKVDAPESLADLCGAGVAFMLANALVSTAKERGFYQGPPLGGPLLILAGLATITDIMPIKGQNRIIVSEALKRFRQLAPIGLLELFTRASKFAAPTLSTKDFGFVIGPRINAAGRVARCETALELLLETDREMARALAQRVDNYNTDRKQIESDMTQTAMAQIVEGAPAQVIWIPDGHQGVAGIVASRIMERCPGGPVAVIVGAHGSARAPNGFNVRTALSTASNALTRFGGHAQAGGFSVKDGMVEEFRKLFTDACALQKADIEAGGTSPDIVYYDAEVKGNELTISLAEEVHMMEPFGEGNEEPLFCIRGAYMNSVRTLGMDGKHLSIEFKDRSIPKAVWWAHGDMVEELRKNSSRPIDVLFHIEISDYGSRHVELRLVDLNWSEIK